MLVCEIYALVLSDGDGWSLSRGAHLRCHHVILLRLSSISAQVLGGGVTLRVYDLTSTHVTTVVLLESHQWRLRHVEDTVEGKRGHFRRD